MYHNSAKLSAPTYASLGTTSTITTVVCLNCLYELRNKTFVNFIIRDKKFQCQIRSIFKYREFSCKITQKQKYYHIDVFPNRIRSLFFTCDPANISSIIYIFNLRSKQIKPFSFRAQIFLFMRIPASCIPSSCIKINFSQPMRIPKNIFSDFS